MIKFESLRLVSWPCWSFKTCFIVILLDHVQDDIFSASPSSFDHRDHPDMNLAASLAHSGLPIFSIPTASGSLGWGEASIDEGLLHFVSRKAFLHPRSYAEPFNTSLVPYLMWDGMTGYDIRHVLSCAVPTCIRTFSIFAISALRPA